MSGNTVARTLRRALVVTSGAALAVSLTGWGAVSATPVMPTQPGVATHAATGTFTAAGKFDAAARLLATAKTPRQRAALTDAALGTSANHLQQLYDTQPLYDAGIDGSATAVATVVSYGDKNIQSYIDSYDRSHGLPAADVQTITPAGPVPACGDPGASGNCPGWGGETDLDVAMFHTLAPKAKIYVVATPTDETQGLTGFPDMMKAIDYLTAHKTVNVISMSLGTPEDDFTSSAQLHDLDTHFKKATDAGITVTASTGDDGATGSKVDGSAWGKRVVDFPAVNSYVTAVGGTVIHQRGGSRTSPDTLWPSSGGGVSHNYLAPSWQSTVDKKTGASGRSLPDITMLGTSGTSQSSPLFAALVDLAAQQAGNGLGFIDPALYALGAAQSASHKVGYVDVTKGSNGQSGVSGYSAGTGFDIPSGWGTIDGATFVPALAAQAG